MDALFYSLTVEKKKVMTLVSNPNENGKTKTKVKIGLVHIRSAERRNAIFIKDKLEIQEKQNKSSTKKNWHNLLFQITYMIFSSFELLSFVFAFKFPEVKKSVCAWIKESSAVCSILSGAHTGLNVVSGWFSFADQADLFIFSVRELSAAPGTNRRWFRTDMKSHSSNLLKALKNQALISYYEYPLIPNPNLTSLFSKRKIC